jgi:hypothetical protein
MMPQAHQDNQVHSCSSHHDRTYILLSQGCHKHINTIRFNPAPATMTELTLCQAKDTTSTSRQSGSFQLQPPRQNLPSVKPRMPQAHQDSQVHSSSRMTELTSCHAKDATSRSRQSASFQLQRPSQNLHSVKPRMPQAHRDSQL